MTAPQTPAHTPVQCVTVEGLLESHAALERLMASTRDRIRDELAREYGVSVGDRVEVGPKSIRLWVTEIDADVLGDRAELCIYGRATAQSNFHHSHTWNPATCRVVRKAGGA